MKVALRQKSEQLKKYRPIRKRDINDMVAEVEDQGNDMSMEEIQFKLMKIQHILTDLEGEEDRVSSECLSKSQTMMSKSPTITGRSRLNSRSPNNITRRMNEEYKIEEDTNESFTSESDSSKSHITTKTV